MDDEVATRCANKIMGKAYTELRYEYHCHINKYGNFIEASKNPPHNVSQRDWDYLVNLVAFEKFKAKSEKNKKKSRKIIIQSSRGVKAFCPSPEEKFSGARRDTRGSRLVQGHSL